MSRPDSGPAAPELAPLADAREAAVVAGWIWDEWARHEPDVDRAANDAVVHAALQGGPLPYFVVARVDGQPVGCASILAADLPTRPELGPWLANVYVLPRWRGRGLGRALVADAMAHGAAIAARLYLYTFGSIELYERLGWQAIGSDAYTGRPITLMRYDAPHGAPRG